jgi:hypothetical protein
VLVLTRVPARVRGALAGALALSAIVVAFSIPLVRAYGRHELNSSTLPHDYLANVVVVLVVIWSIGIAVVVWRCLRARS